MVDRRIEVPARSGIVSFDGRVLEHFTRRGAERSERIHAAHVLSARVLDDGKGDPVLDVEYADRGHLTVAFDPRHRETMDQLAGSVRSAADTIDPDLRPGP